MTKILRATERRARNPTRGAPALLVLAATSVAPAAAQPQVVRVPVSGTVEMGLAPFIERVLEEAADEGADAVVLDIETQGGRVDAALRITSAVSRSAVPVYSFVNMYAYSAGAMIALSAERVVMRAGAVMGAATPVDGSGEKASEKMVSAMRAQMRALTEARGLDPAVAEAMVDEEIAVAGLVEEGKLLTLTTQEAVALDYAVEAADWDDALEVLGLAGAEVASAEVNWAERMVRFFTNPVVAPLLLSLGFLGLLFEIKSPGFGIPGSVGLAALALFFGAHHLVGLAGAVDVILVVAGVILVLVEVLVVPGFGVFGIAGGVALVAGLVTAQLGRFPTGSDIVQAVTVILAAILIVTMTAWSLLRSLPNSWRLRRSGVILGESTDREEGYTSAEVRSELVGEVGVAMTDLRPAGVGIFGEERVDVVSESEWIREGTPIRVLAAEGYRHVVRPEGARSAGPEE